MRIAVNTRFLLKKKLEGFGWFTYETFKRIVKAHPEHTFIFFFDRPYDERFVFEENVVPVVISPPARHPLLFIAWFELMIPRYLKKYNADCFISPDGYLSLRTQLPSLAVIHDLSFEHYPEDVKLRDRLYYRFFFPRFAKKAQRIVTVSHFSKNDIVDRYSVSSEKIDVVYNGVNKKFHPLPIEKQKEVREKHTQGAPYFIYVGALHARKNIVRLLQAFDAFKKVSSSNQKLVLVGEKTGLSKEIDTQHSQMEYAKDVTFTGHIESEVLHQLVGSASALTYVSYFEGFGIPLVEAMQSGIPIITSDCTSLPEVAKDAALLVSPFDVSAIAKAMLQLTDSSELQEDLIQKGHKRALDFSWDTTAEGVWSSLLKMMKDVS